ncbi:MAG TPA: protoporphyrinogen oxidase HemJ [Alphaproteobacteria bacterium]|nr:protoporphyrinogen oxidase HemJ [Alphaproteobacteria bacterium]
MSGLYTWIKALHVISVIAWMAAMFYLPRLFVYHTQVAPGSEASEMLKVMERRLMRAIMNPAMIATLLFGLAMLAMNPALLQQGWLIVKLLFVAILFGMHHAMIGWRRAFEQDRNRRSERFFRIANEVPTVTVIVIVIMVIVRPF